MPARAAVGLERASNRSIVCVQSNDQTTDAACGGSSALKWSQVRFLYAGLWLKGKRDARQPGA